MNPNDAPLKVACVGAGFFSQFQYEAWSRLDVEVVATCALEREAAETVAAQYDIAGVYTDFDEMLDTEKPDLIDIITPPPTHLDFVRAATARGVAMICQKPFTRSQEEAHEAVKIAELAGVPLVIHENFRFQPWYGQIKSMLDAGRLGELYQVSFRLRPGDGQGPEAYLDRQPYFQKMERFLVHETAIHLIDVFRYLFGEIETVTADLVRLNPVIAGEDAGLILFRFAGGARGLFDGNRLVDHAAENRRLTMGEMLIEGSDGTLRLDGDGGVFLRAHDANAETRVDYEWDNRDFGGDCVYRLQRHVVEYLRDGGEVMNTARKYLANLRIEEAVYQSSSQGQRIAL